MKFSAFIIFLLMLLMSCQPNHKLEFEQLKKNLSSHFIYTLKQSEETSYLGCKHLVLHIEGKAKSPLRIKTHQKIFLNTPFDHPGALDEIGFERMKDRHIKDLQAIGIKEHCLEVKDFECRKYHFRNVEQEDLLRLTQKFEDDYSIRLKEGDKILNKIQMKICRQKEMEVSYLQVP